ncbi:MAG: hypothetical protein AB1592_00405 [Pseudomonadota bacterium]
MSASLPRLPDLSALSDAQKDELILSLWETVQAMEAGAASTSSASTPSASAPLTPPAAVEGATRVEDLSRRLRATPPSRRGRASAPDVPGLGDGLRILNWAPLHWLVLVLALAVLVDFAAGWYQRRLIAQQERAAVVLRNAAFEGLYVELERVAYEADPTTTYRATLTMQNMNAARPLYVMLNPVRVFVQSGLTWQEVSSRSPAESPSGVVKLDGGASYSVLFEAPAKGWSELIPGYMHVLIQSDMLISLSATPDTDLVARNNRFYVYLKPHGADDAAIKARNAFPGRPPVFIPMPPH